MDESTHPEHASRTSKRMRTALVVMLAVTAFSLGAAFGRPAVATALSSMYAYVQNWPKMPWKVAVTSQPTKTLVSVKNAADMSASSYSGQATIYTVPAKKYLTVTDVSMESQGVKTDGRLIDAKLESGDFQLNIAPVLAGDFNMFNVRQYGSSQQVEWRLGPGAVITAHVDRDTPNSYGQYTNFYLTGYLTGAP